MDDEEAIARLMVMRYVWREIREGMRRKEVLYYIPKNYMSADAVAVIKGLGEMRNKGFYIDRPVEIMKMLVEVKPFSETYEKYKMRLLSPARIVNLAMKGERVVFGAYFVPEERGMIRIHEKLYRVMNRDEDGYIHYRLNDGREDYVLLLQRFEERPPLRGLLWKEKDTKGLPLDELMYAVKLVNIAEKKYPPITFPVKEMFIVKKNYYSVSRKYDFNPVLGREDVSCVVSRIMMKEGKIVEREIDDLRDEEDLKKLREYIMKFGFDSLSRSSFREFLKEEVEEEKTSAQAEVEGGVNSLEIGR